jgi:hypothetical protein
MRLPYVLTTVGLAAMIAAANAATPAAAFAAWDTTIDDAAATARAAVVPAGRAPVAAALGPVVTVAWKASTFAPVRGYRVTRSDVRTMEPVAARNGCAGVLAEPICVEVGVPAGRWRYGVEAVVGADWRSERMVGAPVLVSARPDDGGQDAIPPPPAGLTSGPAA